MQNYELDAVVKEKGRIEFYVFYNSYAGYHELWTPDIVRKNISSIKNGCLDSKGYLRIRGHKMREYPVKMIKDLDDYHCLV